MLRALDVVKIVQLALGLGLAAVAIRTWRRPGGTAAAWPAAAFVVLGAVGLAASVLPASSESLLVAWARKGFVAGLLFFPYLLYCFMAAFERPRPRADRAAAALTIGVVALTALWPRFPAQGDERPGWWVPYVVAVLVQWSGLTLAVAGRLWSAGRGQAALARRRMGMMALGWIVLNGSLLVAAVAPSGPDTGIALLTRILGPLGVGLFYVGFSPPEVLRIVWRHPDVRLLRQAEEGLMAAVDTAEVTDILLPRVTALFGGKGTALVDTQGTVVAAHGLLAQEAAAIATATGRTDVLSAPMRNGRLVVQSSAYAPFFGQEEEHLLHGLAMFADLALGRAELFAQERASRERAELANHELETFVYTVSHDLKSPLVSLVGFIELVRADLDGRAVGDVAFALDRMQAGATYMQDLIGDLLELSRIGRAQTEPADVDLVRLVEEVADELCAAHPTATFAFGELPVVHMNPLRARQLFTNLLGNAVVHAGRDDVRVEVRAEHSKSTVRLLVSDNGCGIPVAERDRVFRVFEQLAPEPGKAGSGIGLAACRKIVEQLGGGIEVVDSAVGAAFEVRVPAGLARRGHPVAVG